MQNTIWVEKYRPKTIKNVIFQDERQRKIFTAFVENGDIPNLLLSGVQGTGKTSTSKSLINDLGVDRSDVLTINCSKDKIDAMRNQVDEFANTIPIGNFKVVRLEEADFLSIDGQALLRTLIEQVSTSCRFIATCNYENKIIPPLKDRFQHFYFRAPDKEKIAVHAVDILEKEKVKFDLDDLLAYIDVGYPSIRQIIQLLQQNTHKSVLLSPKDASVIATDWKFALLDLISSGNFKAARKIVCESATREEHVDVFTFLYQNIDRLKVKDRDSAIVTIAEYARANSLVADTELNLAAMFIELGKL